MGAQSIGFAIPINYVKQDLEEIKTYGKLTRPFLGIKYILLNKEMAQKNKLPVENGALVIRENLGESAIIKGSSADKAGLKEFDIILECEGEPVAEQNPVSHILEKHKVGDQVILKVLRDKKEIKVKVKLQERK
jgi:S1-C subfamily serine protease